MAIYIRAAREDDLKFIDHLQKKFSFQVGFMPLVWLAGYLRNGPVLMAFENDQPAGYLLGKAGYNRSPQDAIIYQAAIDYDAQRSHIGTELTEHFIDLLPDRITRISLWCAQDIDANLFWEALGFTALAYRQGSDSTQRFHIFWQRRRNLNDHHVRRNVPRTTKGGAMQCKRLVMPLSDGNWRMQLRPIPNFDSLPSASHYLPVISQDRSGREIGPGTAESRPAPVWPGHSRPQVNHALIEARRRLAVRRRSV